MRHVLFALLSAICIGLSFGITGGTGALANNVRDAQLALSLAGPSAASTTVTSAAIDTGETTANAVQPRAFDLLLTAPALTTTILPDTKTMTYNIIAADDSALSVNVTTLVAGAIVQTGAGGAGAVKATYRYTIPTVCQRYIGFTMVSGANTTTAAGVTATLEALF